MMIVIFVGLNGMSLKGTEIKLSEQHLLLLVVEVMA